MLIASALIAAVRVCKCCKGEDGISIHNTFLCDCPVNFETRNTFLTEETSDATCRLSLRAGYWLALVRKPGLTTLSPLGRLTATSRRYISRIWWARPAAFDYVTAFFNKPTSTAMSYAF